MNLTPVKSDDFTWNTSFMYSTNSNEVTSLNISDNPTGGEFFNLEGGFTCMNNVAMVGKPLYVFRGLGWARDDEGKIIYSSYDEASGTVINDYWGAKYVNAPMMTDSLVILGDPNPKFQFSWRNDCVLWINTN